MPRDPYEVLGVDRGADDATIKRAFRRVARELHPDVNRDDPDAEEKFKEAGEAYEVLSDAERRALYDRYGHDGLAARGGAGAGTAGFGGFADIFDAFFGGEAGGFGSAFGGGGGRGGAMQGAAAAVEVEIPLAEAAFGTVVDVEYDVISRCELCHGNGAEPGTPIETCPRCSGTGELRVVTRTAFGQLVRAQACPTCDGDGKVAQTPCSRCDGSGRESTRAELRVDVPAGIADDQRIRLTGRGHAGSHGGPPGDLYVLVHVTPDPRFVRDGQDLVTLVELGVHEAALGATVAVPTLEGEEEIEIASGTQPGAVLTLPGRGFPSLRRRGGRRGDQRVVVGVSVPRNLTAEQRELLERFGETLGDHNAESDGGGGGESLFARLRRALG